MRRETASAPPGPRAAEPRRLHDIHEEAHSLRAVLVEGRSYINHIAAALHCCTRSPLLQIVPQPWPAKRRQSVNKSSTTQRSPYRSSLQLTGSRTCPRTLSETYVHTPRIICPPTDSDTAPRLSTTSPVCFPSSAGYTDTVCSLPRFLAKIALIVHTDFGWAYGDLVAGFTVGIVLVPQSMSYAQVRIGDHSPSVSPLMMLPSPDRDAPRGVRVVLLVCWRARVLCESPRTLTRSPCMANSALRHSSSRLPRTYRSALSP